MFQNEDWEIGEVSKQIYFKFSKIIWFIKIVSNPDKERKKEICHFKEKFCKFKF